jgi:hypothetical protein
VKKRELLEQIKRLQERMEELEARPHAPVPYYHPLPCIPPSPMQPYIAPWQPAGPYWYAISTTGGSKEALWTKPGFSVGLV